MLERIALMARTSIGRGCGFAMLAIGTTMVGLIYDPVQSLRIGGVLSVITSLVLLVKAANAAHRSYRETEVWLMLAPSERPDPAIAQTVLSRILREEYLSFAYYFANGACALIIVSIVIDMAA